MGASRATLERRYVTGDIEVRERNGMPVIEGHAAVFNSYSQNLGGFVEQVARGAFTKTIAEQDIRALFNHDPNFVLGRNVAGTLDLAEDNSGLYYRIKPASTTYANDLMVSLKRGDISQSSFGFYTPPDGDTWGVTENDFPLRTLRQVILVDVSPVTYPAYLDADSGVSQNSMALASLQRRFGPTIDLNDLDSVRAAIRGEVPTVDEGETVGEDPATSEVRAKRIRQIRLIEAELSLED